MTSSWGVGLEKMIEGYKNSKFEVTSLVNGPLGSENNVTVMYTKRIAAIAAMRFVCKIPYYSATRCLPFCARSSLSACSRAR